MLLELWVPSRNTRSNDYCCWMIVVFWVTCEHCSTLYACLVRGCRIHQSPSTGNFFFFFLNYDYLNVCPSVFTGGVILYAGSSGSASPSPGSPSSGYQTQSPSSHSQPSSPEGVSFQEIGPLKQRGEPGGRNPSPRMVFQFPEVNNAPVAQVTTVSSATYSHPTVAKRPCGLTGTFTSKCLFASLFTPSLFSTLFSLLTIIVCLFFQKPEAWCSCVRCVGTLHLGSIMGCTPAKAAR